MNTATERTRRWRERQSDGRIVASVELSHDDIDTLHRAGLLNLHELENRVAIAAAIKTLIELSSRDASRRKGE